MGNKVVIYIVYILVTACLFLATKLWVRDRRGEFFSNVFWYCLLAFILINLFLFGSYFHLSRRSLAILNILSAVFNFCFLGISVLKNLKSRKNKIYAKVTFSFFYILTLYAIIYELTYFNVSGFFFMHVGLLIMSAIYFVDLFHNIPFKPFWICPEFWLISGVFASNTLIVPLLGFAHVYPLVRIMINGYTSIVSGGAIAVLYAFIFKGIICSLRSQKWL